MLENDFGMDNEFGDTSLKALLDFFDNKSGKSANVDVVVNNHYVWWRLVRIWKMSTI
jgi:secreted protein with Ig-like and vWFA domain